jgi:hypothetical protein
MSAASFRALASQMPKPLAIIQTMGQAILQLSTRRSLSTQTFVF